MKIRPLTTALILLASLGALPSSSSAVDSLPAPAESKSERDSRMQWWREARYGMFIHWGLYSVLGGEWHGKKIDGYSEWIQHFGRIPASEYAETAKDFNPLKFNAKEWVKIAKAAGMKYVVITAKHHDGFALFKSTASPFNVVDATPFGRDVIKELAEACHKQGLHFGVYYSQNVDWHHTAKGPDGKAPSMAEYVNKIAVPQMRELMTQYGKIAVMWYDMPGPFTPEMVNAFNTETARQPSILINNRLGGGSQGDYETPEGAIPPFGFPGRDWETCMTTNGSWGYKKGDQAWKPSATLLRNLAEIAGRGGNFLLNVGPEPDGLLPQPAVERLAAVGRWLVDNGQSIYGTKQSPFRHRLVCGPCTRNGQTLYVHVFDWPKDQILRLPLKNRVTSAVMLAQPDQKLAVTQAAEVVEITLPGTPPDSMDSVVKVQFEGEPQPVEPPNLALGKPVKAPGSLPGFDAKNLTDGNPETCWKAPNKVVGASSEQDLEAAGGRTTKKTDGEKVTSGSIEIDLGAATTISKISINTGGFSPSSPGAGESEIQVRTGGNWTTVGKITAIKGAVDFKFAPVEADGVRIEVKDTPKTQRPLGFAEIEVFDISKSPFLK